MNYMSQYEDEQEVRDLSKKLFDAKDVVKKPVQKMFEPIKKSKSEPSIRISSGRSIVTRRKTTNSKVERLSFEAYDALDIARQLTLIDHNLFKKVKIKELMNQNWTKPNKEDLCINLRTFVQHFNQVSTWFQSAILAGTSVKKRALIIEKLVKVAKVFLKLNNFNGLMQIISAIESVAVHRLTETLGKVKTKAKRSYSKIYKLMSPDNNYQSYKHLLNNSTPPTIPYMGIYLTTLVYYEEKFENTLIKYGHPEYLNFERMTAIGNTLQQIQMFQNEPYTFATDSRLEDWLDKNIAEYGNATEEALWETSLLTEPQT